MGSLLTKIIIPVIFIALATWGIVKGTITRSKYGETRTFSIRAWALIPMAIGILTFVFSSFSVVAGGQLAVKVAPGNNVSSFTGVGYVPPFTKVVKFDRRGTVDSNICVEGKTVQEDCADAIVINGFDGGKVFVDLELVYALDTACPTKTNPKKGCVDEAAKSNAIGNYLSFKTDDGLKRQIRNTAKDALGEVAANYDAVDILTENRSKVQEDAQKLIADRLQEKLGVRVVTINFTQMRGEPKIEEAVAKRQTAVQEVAIAKLDAEKQEIVNSTNKKKAEADAEIEMINAEAEKSANLERTKGLTPEVLQDGFNQALGKAGSVIVTNGSTPVIVGNGK